MVYTVKSLKETEKIAEKLAKKIKPGMVVGLYGDLGSGKTTFVRYLVSALGIKSRVQSPTFVISRRYGFVNHVDLYRITSMEELHELGLEDTFKDKDSVTIIEWPEIARNILPSDEIKINFTYLGENEREINVQGVY